MASAHWTDQPYRWHKNTGREVFMVVDGIVDMHYREGGAEKVMTLHPGDALTVEDGEEHVIPAGRRAFSSLRKSIAIRDRPAHCALKQILPKPPRAR
ncbi:MAG: hypothetical protein R3C58_12075 [Parvularculaceae bacterium]